MSGLHNKGASVQSFQKHVEGPKGVKWIKFRFIVMEKNGGCWQVAAPKYLLNCFEVWSKHAQSSGRS